MIIIHGMTRNSEISENVSQSPILIGGAASGIAVLRARVLPLQSPELLFKMSRAGFGG